MAQTLEEKINNVLELFFQKTIGINRVIGDGQEYRFKHTADRMRNDLKKEIESLVQETGDKIFDDAYELGFKDRPLADGNEIVGVEDRVERDIFESNRTFRFNQYFKLKPIRKKKSLSNQEDKQE